MYRHRSQKGELEELKDYARFLEQQNKRYREALKEIKGATSHNKYWKEIAFKALEGDSDE